MQCILNFHKCFETEPLILLDVGARFGLQRPWDQYPIDYLQYFGFEADDEECKRLNKTNNNKNIKYLPAGLSDGDYKETLYITREAGRSSLYEPNVALINQFYDSEGFDVIRKSSLNTTTLNKVIQQEGIDPDFMKLDVQGSELKIIKGADQFHENIFGFEVEVEFLELYKEQPLFYKVDEYMRSIDFELYDLNRYWAVRKNMDLNCSNRAQITFADAIYFRNHDSFYSLSYPTEKELIKKLIKFINVLILYGFFDVAIKLTENKKCPLSKKEKDWIRLNIEEHSRINKFQRLFFNNQIAQKFGVLFHCLGKLFSYKLKTFGWGTDYNTIEERYTYHASRKVVRLFGRK